MRLTTAFLVWTVTSYACHQLGKVFIQLAATPLTSDKLTNDRIHFLLAITLTVVQITFCLLYSNARSPKANGSNPMGEIHTSWFSHATSAYNIAMVMHVLTTLLTNCSLAYTEAASTLAVKLTEPVVSTLALRMWTGQIVNNATYWSLLFVIGGTLVFASERVDIFALGSVLAMISTATLAVRNIAVKSMHNGDFHTSCLPVSGLLPLGLGSLAVLLSSYVFEVQGKVAGGLTSTLGALIFSGVFHVCYSVVSAGVMLRVLDVVSHSLANISKRVLVVLLLYVSGSRHASVINMLGLVVTVVGLLLYVLGKSAAEDKISHFLISVFLQSRCMLDSYYFLFLHFLIFAFLLMLIFCFIHQSLTYSSHII